MATYSLGTQNYQNQKYYIVRRDKILTLLVVSLLLSLGVTDLSFAFRFDGIKNVSAVMTRTGYILNSIIIWTAMYLRKERVIQAIEGIVAIDWHLEHLTNMEISYKKTRIMTLLSISAYGVSLILYLVCRLVYSRPLIALYLSHYYNFFIMSTPSISLLMFFLSELRRRFHYINIFMRSRMLESQLITPIKRVYEVQKHHRRLREISKEVNAIFQILVLGKLIATTVFTFTTLFRFVVSERSDDGVGVAAAVWLMVIGGEICAIIYHFDGLKAEVNRSSCKQFLAWFVC